MKWDQIFVIFIAVMFIGSSMAFAFLSTPSNKPENKYNNLNYSEYPPTYGPYSNQFLKGNVFTQEIPEPVQVNMLIPHDAVNHPGGIWLQYNCDNCQNLISKLEGVVQDYKPRVYLAPYSRMNSTIALTAFRNSLKIDKFNRTKIEDFICENLRYQKPDRCVLREAQ